jgi:hypothetical protein
MDQNEKPFKEKFWTTDMILLTALNIVLIGGIIFGLLLMGMTFSVPITTWLTQALGL